MGNHRYKEKGKRNKPSNACLLVEYCSQDMFGILNELDKLVAYTGGQAT